MQAEIAHLAGGEPAEEGHFILERRYRLVRSLMPLEGERLLDFGCGNGAQTVWFAPHFARTVGADVDRHHLRGFGGRVLARGLDQCIAVRYDGRHLPVGDASIDTAISFEVLEHVEDEAQALREIARVVRPGGRLAMSVPNRWWIFETHGADLPLLPWNRVPLFSWLPTALHDRWARARIYRRRDIVRKIEAVGFEVEHAVYVTAPMDVVRHRGLRDLLRRTVFAGDTAKLPSLATAVLVVARRR